MYSVYILYVLKKENFVMEQNFRNGYFTYISMTVPYVRPRLVLPRKQLCMYVV